VLTTGARGAVGVDAKFLLVDLHFARTVLEQRRDLEAGVTLLLDKETLTVDEFAPLKSVDTGRPVPAIVP